MDKQHILDEIRRTAEANGGRALGRERFEKETGIRESDWRGKFWARWNDAVGEAGLAPNQLNAAHDEDVLMSKLVELIRELGRYPTTSEMQLKRRRDPDFPAQRVYERRHGTKAEQVQRVIAYCAAQGDLEDVIALCEPFAQQVVESDAGEQGGDTALGFVYLAKSGRYYKIGRSNAVGRREYELGIQMPEKLTTVHAIKTDDPAGIESYWHRRFADRRKNGEWFQLSTEDVKVFKRRKFM